MTTQESEEFKNLIKRVISQLNHCLDYPKNFFVEDSAIKDRVKADIIVAVIQDKQMFTAGNYAIITLF